MITTPMMEPDSCDRLVRRKERGVRMHPAGLYLEEIFQFDRKWFGLIRSDYDQSFHRFVEVTRFYPGGCDWQTLNETMEKAVVFFYHTQHIEKKK